tara:strand:+ start:658 stop:954 length:297 start_codon:yes stop_codon:yes gene_type:complete
MSWKDSLRKYRTNVSGSGAVPLQHVQKDHKELSLKLRGIMGAVGSLRNNMPRSVSKVMAKLDEIKEEIYKTEQLLDAMTEEYSTEAEQDWDKTMEDWD